MILELLEKKPIIIEKSIYPFTEERDLIKSMMKGDLEESLLKGEAFLKALESYNNGEVFFIKSCVLHLTVVLIRIFLQGRTDINELLTTCGKHSFDLAKLNSVEEIQKFLNNYIQQLIISFYLVEDKQSEKYEIIQKAKEFINKHYNQSISLEEVASNVYLSPCYFSRIFSELSLFTYQEYLRNVRINAAKKLLIQNKMSLEEIACQVGYKDAGYFIRVFKKVVGTTPRHFTNRISFNNKVV